MKYSIYSAIVVGSGIAGLYATLRMNRNLELSDNILLVTKSNLGESNSHYAQGGMVGVMQENKEDSISSHVADTLKAGAGLNISDTVRAISESSDSVIKDLMNYGVEFDTTDDGKLCYTLEAAHSVRRVLHSGGDATGRRIQEALAKTIQETEGVDIYENYIAVDLLINSEGECRGVILFNTVTREYEVVYSSVVILATGGIGQLYKYTTNPVGATGDGLALAHIAGVPLRDMEFVQFHPTAFAQAGVKNRSLITEALRGEGAKLVDKNGNEFMAKYDARKELAPRDIVTRAICKEMIAQHVDNVFLKASHIDKEKLRHRFPTISRICKKYGIDITKDLIPVAPAAHYFMGGIVADVDGRTKIKGLYAIGEVASTGLHGANRLASNSLLECVVCAYNLIETLKSMDLSAPKQIDSDIKSVIDRYSDEVTVDESIDFDVETLIQQLKELMWDKVGIFRDELSLKSALVELNKLILNFNREYKCLTKEEYEFRNMLIVAKAVTVSALNRQESRGAHFRNDFPECTGEAVHSYYKSEEVEAKC